jgi:hypothetical protein
MKRWLLAIAALLGGSVVWVHADYVIIRVNLAVTKEEKDQDQQGQPGQPARPGQPGAANFGGGMAAMMQQMGGRGGQGGAGRFQPGGAPGGQGFPGGARGGGGFPGGQVPGGQLPGGQLPGMQRGQGGAGGQGGVAGGNKFGGGMQQAPGAQGMAGMMQQMGGGMRGGQGGFPGMAGMGGNKMMSQRLGDDDDLEESTPMILTAIIEARQVSHLKDKHVQFTHKWGKTDLPHPQGGFEWTLVKMQSVAKTFKEKRETIKKKEDNPNRADEWLQLARWALEHGLLEQVDEAMAELAQAESSNQASVLFQKVQAALGRKIARDDAAINWRDKLGNFKTKYSDHYVLLYDVRDDAEADSRLQRLEQNYRGFYYWFALHGKELAVADRRLVAVLVYDKDAFERQHKDIFDNTPLVADGFYARRDNLAVFSAQRLDEGFASLITVGKIALKNYDPDALLKGSLKRRGNVTVDEVAKAQVYALLFKALTAESELASVTHEGTRQLIAAAGLMPRNVETPQWIDFGMASFFESPVTVGDYYGTFWPGVGGVNLPYHTRYKNWADTKNKNLDKDRSKALEAVVTDRYFLDVSDGKKKETEETRARVMAWSLTYYLMQKKLDGLLRYYQELSTLPRDLEFDEEVLLPAFAKAFNLVKAPNSTEIDPIRWANFASDWDRFVRETPVEVEQAIKAAAERRTKKKTTAAPQPNRIQRAGGGGGDY